jgi:hypothetical protein
MSDVACEAQRVNGRRRYESPQRRRNPAVARPASQAPPHRYRTTKSLREHLDARNRCPNGRTPRRPQRESTVFACAMLRALSRRTSISGTWSCCGWRSPSASVFYSRPQAPSHIRPLRTGCRAMPRHCSPCLEMYSVRSEFHSRPLPYSSGPKRT